MRSYFRCMFVLTAALAFVLVWITPPGHAQSGTGDLAGSIYDPSGALVAEAKLALKNSETGAERTMMSSSAGTYRFTALAVVGTYSLTVEHPGFRTAKITGIVISVGTVYTQDVHLEVGAVAQTVTVEAGTQLVQVTDSQVSDVIDSKFWKYLPLEARSQNTFINQLAGVVPDDFAGSTRGAAVNGARGGMGNFLVEGYDNNDQGQGGRGALISGAITSISPEAIQEYRVITHAYNAEYGKGGAFVTDTVLKSGTNSYHGSLFWYNRVQALAANSFFSNRAGEKDRLVRNQAGGSLGGTMFKDRTFFYGSFEGHYRRRSSPLTATGTTQQFLDFINSGAFAQFHESDPNGLCMQNIFDPVTGAPQACPGAFANSSGLGPIFSSLLASQPFPLSTNPDLSDPDTFTGAGNLSSGIVYPVPVYGDVTVLSSEKLNENRISAKIDHRLGPNDQLSGTFLFEDSDEQATFGGADTTIGPDFIAPGRSVVVGVTETHNFSPSVLNQFRVSFLRHRRDFPNVAGAEGIPSIVTAFDPLGVGFGNASALPQFFTDNQFQYQDHLSVVRGKHTFKGGAEYRRTRNGSAFEATKNGFFLPYGIDELATDGFFGDEADQALFGGPVFGSYFFNQASINPITGGLPEYYRGYRANEFAAYFQDDWRIHPRLTLNLGLRWEYFGPPHNFREGLDSNFYFGNAVTPIPACIPVPPATTCTANSFFPTTSPVAARVRTGGFQQRDHNIWGKDTNNFGPRAGFAWDIRGNQKLVLRGGGGIFYDRIWNNLFENIRFNAPFFSFATVGTFGNGIPSGAISTPGLLSAPFTTTSAFSDPRFAPVPSPRHMDENLLTQYIEQFYLGVQWEFRPTFVLEVNGVGTLGRKLFGVVNINTFNGRTRGGNSQRPNRTIASDNFRTNAFKSSYYGMQVVVRKSFSHGLSFNGNYTWSHTVDEISDAFNSRLGLNPTDNFNISVDRGNADFDVRHRGVISFFYELPWMKAHRVVGGWRFSGSVTLQTGVPVPLTDTGRDPNADGLFTERPVFLGSGNINNTVTNNSPADGYFDTAQFRRTATDGSDCGSIGQFISTTRWWCDPVLGRNKLIGPGFFDTTFGVAKTFKITETLGATFQANFFNVFNRSNFRLPVGNINNTQFGRSIATFDPRIIQLALRFDF